jgi:hypothetical protein
MLLLSYFPGLLIPIAIFFGLNVWFSMLLSKEAMKNLEAKRK